jgi:geranylgeranyl reductase family protein
MYDALILGAGPAGSSAAYHAARAGLRVLVVDREPFPRPKTCGDALVPRALAAVRRMGIDDLRGHPLDGVRIFHARASGSRYEGFRSHPSPHAGLVVEREVLDARLLARATAAGAEFQVGTALAPISRDGAGLTVTVQTGETRRDIRAAVVVAATGSGVRSGLLGQNRTARPVWGVAARAYLQLDRSVVGNDLEVHFPVVHEGRHLSGYAWLFPVRHDRVNVGVGVFRPDGAAAVPVRGLLERFVAERRRLDPRLAGATPCGPVRSAPIAIGPVMPRRRGVLAVGDAAGLANPFLGEGIVAALESGELAAQAMQAGPDGIEKRYARLLRDRFPRHFALRRSLVALHGHPSSLLERGWDVVGFGGDRAGDALERLLWDQAPNASPWASIPDLHVRAAATHVRANVVASARRVRPVLGELVQQLLGDPEVGFGCYAAFAAAVRQDLVPARPRLSAAAREVVTVLEIVGVVRALHAALDRPPRESRRWGRDTLDLVLADCLTARALARLYRLEPDLGRMVGSVAQRLLRGEALMRVAAGCAAAASDGSAAFLVAARAALADRCCDALPDDVERMATALAAVKSGAHAPSATTCRGDAARRAMALVLETATAWLGVAPARHVTGAA